MNYSKYVKQVHLPAKSAKKEREMLNLISGLNHPVKQAIKVNPSTSVNFDPAAFLNARGSRSAGQKRANDPSSKNGKNMKLPQIYEDQNGS